MNVVFSSDEVNLLTEILTERRGTLREEIHKTDTPHFKDTLRAEKAVLDRIIQKMEDTADESIRQEIFG